MCRRDPEVSAERDQGLAVADPLDRPTVSVSHAPEEPGEQPEQQDEPRRRILAGRQEPSQQRESQLEQQQAWRSSPAQHELAAATSRASRRSQWRSSCGGQAQQRRE
jgi:hypothetical protein